MWPPPNLSKQSNTKMKIHLLAILIAGLFATSPLIAQPAQQRGGVGTNRAEKVAPGAQHTNTDGVTVVNDGSSHGNATIDPSGGTATAVTTVRTRTGFVGAIRGLENDDRVSIGSSNTATVTGEGGSISVGGGSTVTITNTSTQATIQVTLASGATVNVAPNSSVTVQS
jgi:hypothetical protein